MRVFFEEEVPWPSKGSKNVLNFTNSPPLNTSRIPLEIELSPTPLYDNPEPLSPSHTPSSPHSKDSFQGKPLSTFIAIVEEGLDAVPITLIQCENVNIRKKK